MQRLFWTGKSGMKWRKSESFKKGRVCEAERHSTVVALRRRPVSACWRAPTPFSVQPPCHRNKLLHASATKTHYSVSPCFAPRADKAQRHTFRNLSFHFCIIFHVDKKTKQKKKPVSATVGSVTCATRLKEQNSRLTFMVTSDTWKACGDHVASQTLWFSLRCLSLFMLLIYPSELITLSQVKKGSQV